MAEKAETIGVGKAELAFFSRYWPSQSLQELLLVWVRCLRQTVYAGTSTLPYGVARLFYWDWLFCLGLILVIIAGAELFTGNNLIVLCVGRTEKLRQHLYCAIGWCCFLLGNFIGSVLLAGLVFLSGQYFCREMVRWEK